MTIIDIGTDPHNPDLVRNISFIFDVNSGRLLDGHNAAQEEEFNYLKYGCWTMVKDRAYPQSEQDRKNCWKKAKRYKSKKYHAVGYNCEHFVRGMLTGDASSKQVKKTVATMGAVVVAGVINPVAAVGVAVFGGIYNWFDNRG